MQFRVFTMNLITPHKTAHPQNLISTQVLSSPLIRVALSVCTVEHADQIFNATADLHFSGQFTCSNHAGNNLSLIKGGLGAQSTNSNPSAISGKMGDCGKELIGNCFWLFIRRNKLAFGDENW